MSDLRKRIYRHYLRSHGQSAPRGTADGFAPRAATLRRLIRKHVPADLSAEIIDLGCGHGALIHFLREAGYRYVTGVDVSTEQVAEARRLGVAGVHEGDLLESLQGLPACSQDVVIAFDVIEHFRDDELLPFVDGVLRVLKPGGRWIIHVPNGGSPFFGAIRYGDLTHEQAFTRNSLAQLLLSSGFVRPEYHESGPVPVGPKGVVRWVLWQAIRWLTRAWIAVETGDSGRDAILTRNMLAIGYKPSTP